MIDLIVYWLAEPDASAAAVLALTVKVKIMAAVVGVLVAVPTILLLRRIYN